MKYAPLLLLSFLLPPALNAQCVQLLSSGSTSDLYAVAFWDGTTGLAVGDSGVVLRTTNGGSAWTRPNTRTQQALRGLFTLNSGGLKAWAVGAGGTIRYSADGGQSWVQQPAPVRTDLHAVAFSSANNGLAVGDCGAVLRTTNGGATWTRVDAKTTETLYAITFQANTAIAAGDNGVVCRSTNGGATWTATNLGSQPWRSAAGTSATNLWLAGTGADLRRTTNGGQNWTSLPIGSTDWYGFDVNSSGQRNVLVGAAGKIYLSQDGGVSWENRSNPGITTLLRDAVFVPVDSSTAYACGDGGVLLRVRLPQAAAAALQDTLCAGGAIALSGGGGAPYSWSGPGGYTASVQNPMRPNATTTMSGLYILTATAAPGCTDTAVVNIKINAPPTAAASAVKTTLCAGETLQLNASGGGTYSWSGPGGYTASGQNPTRPNATTAMTGPYTVLVTDGNGCTDTEVVNITVTNPPTAAASAVKTALCAGETLQLNASGGGTYTWSGPGGYTASGQNPTRPNATTAMSGPYTVLVTDANGCTDTEVVNITVTAPPTAAASAVKTTLCAGETLQLNASGGGTYTWSGPGGYTASGQNPTRPNATTAMTGPYTVLVTDGNGCTDTEVVNITVTNPPTAAASAVKNTLCVGETLQLTASGGGTYTWSGPGGYTASGQNPARPDATTAMSGPYTVLVTDGNGCTDTEVVNITVTALPTAAASAVKTTLCAGETLQLNASGGGTYIWSGPGGYTASGQNPTRPNATTAMTGPYTVLVTDGNGCTDTEVVDIMVNDLPTASATGGALSCLSPVLTLQGQSNTPGATYAWVGPGGFNSGLQNPPVNVAGVYTLTVTAAGCAQTATATVTGSSPVVVAMGTPGGTLFTCSQTTLTLVAQPTPAGGGYSFLWSSGLGTGQQATAVLPGGYSVTVTDTGSGCSNVASVTLTGSPNPPAATANGGALSCGGGAVQLQGSSSIPGSSFNWSGPGGFSSAQQNPVVNQVGAYTLTVTASGNCTGTATALVTPAGNPPQPTIAGSTTFCGDTLSLTVAPPLFTQYSWSTGGSTQAIKITATGTYTVTVTDLAGCTGTDTHTVNAGNALTPAISGPGSTCGGTVTLDAGPGYKTYLWSTGAKGQTIPVNAVGTYLVTVTNGPACTGTDAHVVDATAAVSVGISGPSQVCGSGQATLTATPGFIDYQWSNGQSGPSITVGAGNYTVEATSDKGCTATATQTVTSGTAIFTTLDSTICQGESVQFGGQLRTQTAVYTATFSGSGGCDSIVQLTLVVVSPGITVVTPQDLCEGNALLLQASGCPGCDFAWSDNLGFEATVTASPTTTTTYTVTATDALGCSEAETITVRVRPAQRILVQESICSGKSFTYNNKTYNKTGKYTDYVLSPEGCTDTVTIELYVVLVKPFFTMPDLMIMAPGEEEDMLNVADNDSVPPGLDYEVKFINNDPKAGSLNASPDGSVTYRLIDDDFRGSEKLDYRICDAECGLGCDTGTLEIRILQFSNAFSPNGDGNNDLWDPLEIYRQMGVDINESAAEMYILNSWGDRMFSATPYRPWDGKVNGRDVPAGTYYYVLFVGNGQVDKRSVTVLR